MKIAHIVSTFPPYKGGMGNSAACFAGELLKFNHQVTVLTTNFDQSAEEKTSWQDLELIKLKPFLKIGNTAILPGAIKYLKNYDVVHLHYPFYGTAELIALVKLRFGEKIKLVLHYHMDNQARGLKGFIFSLYRLFFLPIILRLSDEITCASLDYIKHSSVGGYYLKHRDKFSQVPFGVDLKQFYPAEQKSEPSYNILFVGGLDRAHYFKGVDKLIEAYSQVYQKIPQAYLTILGQGDLEVVYKHLAKEKKLEDKINFVDNADNDSLVKCYQSSDLLVLPSINQNEAFGLVLLEAMACGKPVVASNLPGVRSVFKNGKQGLTVRPGDSLDLAEKILMILEDQKNKNRMGEMARRLAEKRYSWHLAGEKLNEIYYRVRYAPKVNRKTGEAKKI